MFVSFPETEVKTSVADDENDYVEHAAPFLDTALDFLRNGFPIVPLPKGSKGGKFFWKAFQDNPPTEAQTIRWFTGAYADWNWAPLLGRQSEFVALDLDSDIAVQIAKKHFPEPKVIVHSKRGRHGYFRMPKDHGLGERDGKPWMPKKLGLHYSRHGERPVKLGIDILADGALIVGPGSQHKSGIEYRLEIADGMTLAEALAASPTLTVKQCKGFCACHSTFCQGNPDPWHFHASDGAVKPTATPDFKAYDHVRTEWGNVFRRAAAWINARPGVPEGGRDLATANAALALTRGFLLDDTAAYVLLADYNQRHIPPLTDREVRSKIASSRRRTIKEPDGWLRDAPLKERNPKNEHSGARVASSCDCDYTGCTHEDHAPERKIGISRKHHKRWLAVLYAKYAVNTPQRYRCKRIMGCCTMSLEGACEETGHAPDFYFPMACERASCPYCSSRRAQQIIIALLATWGPKVCLIRVKLTPGPANTVIDRVAKTRSAIKSGILRVSGKGCGYRCIKGYESVIFVLPIENEATIGKMSCREQWKREVGGEVLNCEVMDTVLACHLIGNLWREPSEVLKRDVESGNYEAACDHPWFSGEHITRTSANTAGREAFPWPSQTQIRSALSEQAESERKVPRGQCSHATGAGGYCCKPLTIIVRRTDTGEKVFSTPYTEEFWRIHREADKHTSAILLGEADLSIP